MVDYTNNILVGDCVQSMRTLPDGVVNTCVTSPPYFGLRDYGVDGQLGVERTPEEFVQNLVEVFREVRRILRPDGTLWLNLGDSYAAVGGPSCEQTVRGNKNYVNSGQSGTDVIGTSRKPPSGLKPKDLIGIPWKVAFALQADGWYLRQDIIWHKPNPMPESVKDRCTKAHEYIFLLSKSPKYYFDGDAIKEDAVTPPAARDKASEGYQADYPKGDRFSSGERVWGQDGKKNKRSVWTVATKPFKGAHFATFPPTLVEPCILAGAPVGGLVLDPFGGSGTTGLVAAKNGRNFVLCELNPEYAKIAECRINENR
jgi:site-specific DNA-methyltransferase (adenine-specific)